MDIKHKNGMEDKEMMGRNLAFSRISRLESSMSEKSNFYDDPHFLFILLNLFLYHHTLSNRLRHIRSSLRNDMKS